MSAGQVFALARGARPSEGPGAGCVQVGQAEGGFQRARYVGPFPGVVVPGNRGDLVVFIFELLFV